MTDTNLPRYHTTNRVNTKNRRFFGTLLFAFSCILIFTLFYPPEKYAAHLAGTQNLSQTTPSLNVIPENPNPHANQATVKYDLLYNLLIEQQIQLNELRKNYALLSKQLEINQHQPVLAYLILSFAELREQIIGKQDYQDKLQEVILLGTFNRELNSRLHKLKSLLSNNPPKSREELAKEFNQLVPALMARKSYQEGSAQGLWANFREKLLLNFREWLTIRRIDGTANKPTYQLDLAILEIEKSLAQGRYQEMLKLLSLMDEKYQVVLGGFKADLENNSQIDELISQIAAYLKYLINQSQ